MKPLFATDPYGYPLPHGTPQSQDDTLAMVSLGIGLLALSSSCCCGCISWPASFIAILVGAIGMGRTNNKTPAYAGIGMGVAALVMQVAMVLLGFGMNILAAVIEAASH